MRGKIVRWVEAKGFGFIETPDLLDVVFLHKSVLKGSGREGLEVEFEAEQNPKDPTQMRAKSARVVTTTPPPVQPPAQSQEIGVGFRIEDPEIVEVEVPIEEEQLPLPINLMLGAPDDNPGTTKQQRLKLPVFVIVKKGRALTGGIAVDLDTDGEKVRRPVDQAYTLDNGEAYFEPLLPVTATSCALVAIIDDKHYSAAWRKKGLAQPIVQAEPEPAVAKADAVQPVAPQACKRIVARYLDWSNGWAKIELKTLSGIEDNASGVACTVRVISAHEFEIDGTDETTVTTENGGIGIVKIRFKAPAYRGRVIFQIPNTGVETEVYFLQPREKE